MDWHSLSAGEALKQLGVDPQKGLSTGAAEQRLFFHLFTAVLFKIAEIPYAEAVVLTVTAACICLAGYRMVRFVHNSDGKKDLPFWLSQVSEAS